MLTLTRNPRSFLFKFLNPMLENPWTFLYDLSPDLNEIDAVSSSSTTIIGRCNSVASHLYKSSSFEGKLNAILTNDGHIYKFSNRGANVVFKITICYFSQLQFAYSKNLFC